MLLTSYHTLIYPDVLWCLRSFLPPIWRIYIRIFIYIYIYLIYTQLGHLLVYQFTTFRQKWLMSRSSNPRCSRERRPRLSSTGCTVLDLQDRMAESVMFFSPGNIQPPKFYMQNDGWKTILSFRFPFGARYIFRGELLNFQIWLEEAGVWLRDVSHHWWKL